MLLCVIRKERLRVAREYRIKLIVLSLLNVGIFNVLSAFAVGLLEGGRAAIIAFTMPVWVAIFQVLSGVRLSAFRMTAILFGTFGMLLIIISIFQDTSFNVVAACLMGVAALSWAIGSILLSRTNFGIEASALAFWNDHH